jgi:type IV pilus assembly protein PilN
VLGAAVATIVACLFIQKVKESELAAILADNAVTQGQIDAIGKQMADHTTITARLKELRDREDAIQKLQSARTGPTSALLELSHLLTVGGGGPSTDRDKIEQLKRDNPSEVYNANWDPRRLWLTTYKEADRVVKMGGLARDGEDVSELERRLKLSDYFADVKLLPGSKVTDSQTHQELFQWELSAKVRY